MTLLDAPVGSHLTVGDIPDDDTRLMALRLGIAEGARIEVASRVPGGPVVLRFGALEVALGREVCRAIPVAAAPRA